MHLRNLFVLLPTNIQFRIRASFFGQVVILIKSFKLSRESNKFYSQFGEDVILSKYLKEKTGFYLDIGSGDPVRGSNTYFLYKLGWSGILIDPLTRNITGSRIIRRKDRIIQALVGTTGETYSFFEMYPYEYSTTNKEIAVDLVNKKRAKIVKQKQLKALSISELELKINSEQPSLLSVDCEGLDLEVLKTIDLDLFKFRVICVEDFDFDQISKSSVINKYLDNYGYKLVDRAGPSSIYVNSTWLQNNLI